ncbi:porin family protein [Pontimicrobium sp. SW4]|uniref:Porin family protein n=1 Tax=Pontimicrobium sp. SW4 TaxID=3153519 RepID=A0AAU7BPA5_9FLAO
MKKLCIAVVAIFFAGSLNAQSLKFGVKSGINVATINGGELNVDSRIGFHIGVVSEIEINNKFSIQPELMYSSQGAEEDIVQVKLDYLLLPLLAKYHIVNGFSIEVGPQFAFLVNDEIELDNDNQSVFDTDSENFDLSASFGLGYQLKSSLFFQVRYNLGIIPVVENPDVTNGVFQLSAGYQF